MDLKKSSDEIVTELFDSLNTVNASESDSSCTEDNSSKKGNKEERKKLKKSKKSKKSKKAKHEDQSKSKRHKKKKKKRKKHKRKLSNSESDSDEARKKKSKRKSNKSKKKETSEEIIDKEKVNDAVSDNTEKILNVPEKINEFSAIDNSDTSLIPLPPPLEISVNENSVKSIEPEEIRNKIDKSVTTLKVADVFVEDLIESGDQKTVKSLINPTDKPKMAIKISDLRNSTVLELAEEQAKLQADLHEEGEIPDSSNSSADSSLFKNALQDNGVTEINSSKNGRRNEFFNRGISSNLNERKFSDFPSDNTEVFTSIQQISVEKEINKDKRLNEKLKRKSKERERSKDHSPHNLKYKRRSIDKTIRDSSKDGKKIEQERSREKRRSRERKGARSRSKEKRSRSRTKSRGRHRSRSKDRKRSRSRERKRSKSKDKTKLGDADKYKEGKKSKREHGDSNKDEEVSKYKHHSDISQKNEHSTDDSKKVKRSKSKDRKRDRSRSKESVKKKRDKKTPDRRARSRDRHSKRSRSSRSRSRSKHKSEYFIDKSKLLEIARKNALNMIKQGQVNIGVNSGIAGAVGVSADVNKVAAITAGGKTVDELTDFCKLLSQKEATGQESISSESSSDNENERPFHHPFQLKERPNNIIMNIRNCASLPVKTHQEKTTENAQQLRLQFPVSSGQQHRKTESEWIPVSSTKNEPKAIMPPPSVAKFEPPPLPAEPEREKIIQPQFVPLPPPPPPPVFMEPVHHHTNNYELSNMISERLSEIRHQYEASNQSYQQINCWPGMENQAGLFTGSTGARVLSAAELASGQQAWAKKDQLICAQPVSGGMGMSLLQKMGWKPGEGLGKHSEGSLEPLKLPVKMDKRGLVCAEELPRRHRIFPPPPPKDVPPPVKSLEGKHPVSLLVEYCSRRHFPPPVFTVISEEGPAHKKNFVFKVTVNGIDYQPTTPSPNKKQAKSEAATLCLKSLNILPTV